MVQGEEKMQLTDDGSIRLTSTNTSRGASKPYCRFRSASSLLHPTHLAVARRYLLLNRRDNAIDIPRNQGRNAADKTRHAFVSASRFRTVSVQVDDSCRFLHQHHHPGTLFGATAYAPCWRNASY